MAQQFYIIILEEFFMTPILSLHNIDVAEFLAVLDTCEGNVFLVTNEGDRLNLKSKLIICENKNDESKLFRFNFFGDTADAEINN